MRKQKLINELEIITEKLNGKMKQMLRCNSMGRQSNIIEIEYNVKETK